LDGSSSPAQLSTGKHGATASPAFSPDGKQVAWLQMDRDGFEADRRKIVVSSVGSVQEQSILAKDWHLSPSSVRFSADGSSIIGIVEDAEQSRLFELALDASAAEDIKMLSSYGGVSSATPLSDQSIFVSASSLLSPSDLYLVSPRTSFDQALGTNALRLTNFGQSKDSSIAGLDLGRDPEQFSYPGAGNRTSHGWIHYPPGYDASKEYALAVIIHGGPEGAFTNSWSNRWNPAVFAATGLFVITIDPAGSTGFGQAYQEEILGSWGGAPYLDIVAGVRHILHRFANVDPERVVAAGASYGGYMINWINGHNEDKLFKGLVCHDGVFSTLSTFYSTEELYFPVFEFGGVPWEKREEYEKWSPEKFTQNWETPQLTIAGGKDYRLPESEGISVFNTLQRRGVPSRLVYFPNENHWVLEPKNSLKWHGEVLGWLLKYSRSEGSGDDAAATAPSLVFQGH
jgi:dipeptidyl aminopeptidase/acylaminoacyl peptidase